MDIPQPATSNWIGRVASTLIYLLALIIGLHLHRATALFYLLAALILWQNWQPAGPKLQPWWPVFALTGLYSLSFVVGMLHWQLWSWPEDWSELINAMLLPLVMLGGGLVAGARGWRLPVGILLSYTLGALLFIWLTLALNRQPWWDLRQGFDLMVRIPWGTNPLVNVRSVEQNAMPAMVLLPVSVAALLQPWRPRRLRVVPFLGMLLGLLGLHCTLAFEGRIGVLVLLLAALPWVAMLLRQLASTRRRRWLMAVLGTMALAAASTLPRLGEYPSGTVGWGQGLCDERLSLHLSILSHLGSAPWGGRQMQVPYWLCDGSAAMHPASMAHNVVLDMFLDVGIVPALLLITLFVPLLGVIGRGFIAAWHQHAWDWKIGLWWGWLVLLGCQWSFQPLFYSDELLFYLTFFVVGAMAGGFTQPPMPSTPSQSSFGDRPMAS